MSVFESQPEPEQDPLFLPPGTMDWEKQTRKDSGWSALTLTFVGVLFIAFITAAFLSLWNPASEDPRDLCGNNLKQIGARAQ